MTEPEPQGRWADRFRKKKGGGTVQEARGRQDAPSGIKLSQNRPYEAAEAHLQDTRVAFLMGAPQGLSGKELS